MTDKPIVTLDHSGAVHVRLQRPCSQEFQLSLLELPALVAEIARVLPARCARRRTLSSIRL